MGKSEYSALTNLCIDARRGRVGNFSTDCEKHTDEAVRAGFVEILGTDQITYRVWNKHKGEVFEIIEDVLNETVPDAWDMSPFYNELVEIKNARLGQKNEFIVEDNSTLIVSRFSGNHWDIDRQKLPAGKTFSLETEWYAVMVYDELERFLKGVTTTVKMFDTIQLSIQRSIDDRVYSAFNGAGTYLPAVFKEAGSFSKKQMLTLATRVQIESGRTVRLAGTRTALAHLDTAVNAAWVSNEMKQDKNTTGYLRIWEGFNTIEIPQTFNRGTYNFKSPDNIIYVLPENYKPIKLFFEGDTRSRDLNELQNNDQTISYQVQTKMGVGVVFDSMFGTYTITG